MGVAIYIGFLRVVRNNFFLMSTGLHNPES